MKKLFEGVATALITPFDSHGFFDKKTFEKQIEFQISNGINALVVCGTTGEPSTLNVLEKKEVIKHCINIVSKRVPVIVGTGSNNTNTAIEQTQFAESLKADGALVVTPYYNKCSQNGIVEYYKQIAKNSTLPIIAYNVPSRTGLNILPKTAKALFEINNVIAIKEASNFEQLMDVVSTLQNMQKTESYIYTGDDTNIVPSFSVGCNGVISVVSNIIPAQIVKLFEICKKENNYKKAAIYHNTLLPFIKSIFLEVNPIGIKMAMKLEKMDTGFLRSPLTEMDTDNINTLKDSIENFKQKIKEINTKI